MAQHRAEPAKVADPPGTKAFRPDIQGLRALAVTLVVVYHLYPGLLTGGYIGVDVFFVISGYLITGLIARGARRDGRVGLVGFYARRARRLLPAAVLVLTVTWIAARIFLPVTQLNATATQIRASALYMQNWVLARDSVDYLKADAAPTPVQHFWSLSVEEQFYLIWPMIFVVAVFVAARFRRRNPNAIEHRIMRALAFVVAGSIVVVSLLYSLHETRANPAAAYFQTGTRIWELGIGGLLALLPGFVTRRVERFGLLAWAGLGLILAAAFTDNAMTPFPGTAAIVPVIGAGFMLVCGSSAARLSTSAIASVRPAVFIGDLSYSIYLWHWPMIVLWKAYAGHDVRPLDGVGIGVAAVLASWLTTKLVETPIRHARIVNRKQWRGLAVAALAIVPVAMATSFLDDQHVTRPAPINAAHAGAQVLGTPSASRTSANSEAGQHAESLAQWLPDSTAHTALSPLSSKIAPSVTAAAGDGAIAAGANCTAGNDADRPTVCTFGDTTQPALTVALVGDSHAAQWSTALVALATQQHWKLVVLTHDACTFGAATIILTHHSEPFTQCHVWGQSVLTDLETTIKPDVVLTTARVSNAGVPAHPTPDATSYAAIGQGEAVYWQSLMAHHIPVVALHETPEPREDVPSCLGSHGATVDGCAAPVAAALVQNTPIDVASKIVGPAVPVIDMNHYLCTEKVCPAVVGNVIVYRDSNHLTETYTRSVEPFLLEELSETEPFAGT